MPAGITGAVDREDNGGEHADHTEGCGKAHVTDQNAVEHGADNGGGRGLLGNLIGRCGDDIALQRFVVFQHINHVPEFQPFRFADTLEVFGLIIGGDSDAYQHNTDEGYGNTQPGYNIQKFLIEASAVCRHQFCVDNNVQHHRNHVVQSRLPDANGGTLFRIIGEKSGQSLCRHIHDGIADDVDHVAEEKNRNSMSLAGEKVEHAEKPRTLNCPTEDHQRAHLPERRVKPVIYEGEQGVGDRVKNAGESQQTAYHQCCNAVSDTGGVACKTDEKINCHAVKSVECHQNNLPKFCTAIFHAVNFALG